MKYPFADTPANRRLETLIDRSMGESTVTRRDVGDYIVHIYPNRVIRRNPQIDDLDTYTSGAYVGVIDKRTGNVGLDLFRSYAEHDGHFSPSRGGMGSRVGRDLDVDSLLETLTDADATRLKARFPHLVNLGENRHTYLDLYIESMDSVMPHAPDEATLAWLLAHDTVPTGQGVPPAGVQALIDQRAQHFASDGTDPAHWYLKSRKLVMAYVSPNVLAKWIPEENDVNGILEVRPYTQHGRYRDVAQVTESLSLIDVPGIVLDVPEADYGEASLALEARFKAQQKATVEAFVGGLLVDCRDELLARHLATDSALPPAEIEANVERLFDIGTSNWEVLERLASPTPEGLRNNLQILDRLGQDRSIFLSFTSDERIARGIEAGEPMKEVLAHLPLANLSKKTINNFVENFCAFTQPKADSIPTFHLEKGPAPCHRSLNYMLAAQVRHESAALLTTLPESAFQRGETRSADGMVDILTRYPQALECLSARVIAARRGEASLKEAFSWVPGALADDNERYRQIEDARRIIGSVFYTAVLCHLHALNEAEEPSLRLFYQARVSGEEMMGELASTGEYRHLLHAEEEAHRRIHDFYKRGKPDSSMSWNPATEVFHYGDYTVEPITDNATLTEEGRELNHCVGSYLRAVLANESYIFSVKHRGKRDSTLEMRGDSYETLAIEQHRAMSNAPPKKGAVDAVAAFFEAIEAGEIDVDFEPCADRDEVLEAVEDPLEMAEIDEGYRFRDREFILSVIHDIRETAPALDIWACLRRESEDIQPMVEALREEYEAVYGRAPTASLA